MDRQHTTDQSWYLVQCKPRDCFRAQNQLREQEYDVYLPTHTAERRKARQIYYVTEPLFPHYLFLQLPTDVNWSAVRSTRGVSRVVSFNGKPVPVSEQIVNGIKHQCDVLNGLEPEPLYKKGDTVVITDGCFRELEAVVQTTHKDERVILLLDLLNRRQEIELPISSVANR